MYVMYGLEQVRVRVTTPRVPVTITKVLEGDSFMLCAALAHISRVYLVLDVGNRAH